MPHDISRREFNQAAAALPLFALPIPSSDVSGERSQMRLQVQCGHICVDGRHLDGDDWRLEFLVRLVQRRESDPRYWYGRIMVPTEDFIQCLRDHAIQVIRHRNPKRLVAERTMLRGGVAGLCVLLDSAFPTAQQHEFYTDPTPERWGDYTIPDNRVIKRFWVGNDGGNSS